MTGLGIAADAAPLLMGLAVLALTLFFLASWLGRWPLWLAAYSFVVLAVATAFFFRDPVRVGERGPQVVVAPADGRVVAVDSLVEPDYIGGDAIRIAIYLALYDVHVQRSPVDGVVDHVQHRAGGFAPAWSGRASENEATIIGISTGRVRVLVRQVAGTVARRIVTYVQEGDLVDQAERIGLIRFGSRVETYLPPDAEPAVREGDRVRAGATVIAKTPEPATMPEPDAEPIHEAEGEDTP